MSYSTDQEEFWAGDFGNQYIDRNQDESAVGRNLSLFAEGLRHAGPIRSVVELGCNIGLNLSALRVLLPEAAICGLEINTRAAELAKKRIPSAVIRTGSLLEAGELINFDLVVVKGVLIHIAPDALPRAYETIHSASKNWIFLCEYFNPTPVEVRYRGHADRLFKRDFAGDLLDHFPDLRLADYGFRYKRDRVAPADNLTWFLLEKTPAAR